MEHTLAEKLMHQLNVTHNLMLRRGHHHKSHHDAHEHGHEGHAMFKEHMRAQRHLIALLQEKNGQSQKDLAEALHIRPSSLSELLSKLEQHGFVERKVNEEDKRVTDVFLTDEGKEKAQEIRQHRSEFVENLFNTFSEEEKQTLLSLLAKLNTSLEEKPEACSRPHHLQHGHHMREKPCHGAFHGHHRRCF